MKNVVLIMALVGLVLPVTAQPGPGPRGPRGEQGPMGPGPEVVMHRMQQGLDDVLEFDEAQKKVVLDSYEQFFDDMKALRDEAREAQQRPERDAMLALESAREDRIKAGLSEADYAAYSVFHKMSRRQGEQMHRQGPHGEGQRGQGQQGRGQCSGNCGR